MKEEDNIRHKAGTGNPFKVPEGYFEHFTASLMDRLPEQAPRKRTLLRRLRPVWYAAAAVCGIALCTGYLLRYHAGTPGTGPETEISAAAASDANDPLDELLDYTMTDNMEIAYYLTTAD